MCRWCSRPRHSPSSCCRSCQRQTGRAPPPLLLSSSAALTRRWPTAPVPAHNSSRPHRYYELHRPAVVCLTGIAWWTSNTESAVCCAPSPPCVSTSAAWPGSSRSEGVDTANSGKVNRWKKTQLCSRGAQRRLAAAAGWCKWGEKRSAGKARSTVVNLKKPPYNYKRSAWHRGIGGVPRVAS